MTAMRSGFRALAGANDLLDVVAADRRPDVQVGDLHDPESLEVGVQARDRDRDLADLRSGPATVPAPTPATPPAAVTTPRLTELRRKRAPVAIDVGPRALPPNARRPRRRADEILDDEHEREQRGESDAA